MFSIIIPFRNNSKLRERNLFFTLNYYKKYLPSAEIIVVEQNTHTDFTPVYDKIDKYLKIKTKDNLFSKALLFNSGYNLSRTKYIITADADCIIDKNVLENIEDYYEYFNNHFVLPYSNHVYYLSETETEYFINNDESNISQNQNKNTDSIRGASGGIGIMSSVNFYKVGGFDERFKGWGAEDDAFYNKCSVMGVPPYRIPYDLIHLHHPVFYEEDNNYGNNLQTYNDHFSKSREDFIKDINYKYLLNQQDL
jgi:predicted glycosyltransferase involved in capsule biosynthesis